MLQLQAALTALRNLNTDMPAGEMADIVQQACERLMSA